MVSKKKGNKERRERENERFEQQEREEINEILNNENKINRSKEILHLGNDLSYENIRKQYKKLSIKYHPDKGGTPEKFQTLKESYETLIKTYHLNRL